MYWLIEFGDCVKRISVFGFFEWLLRAPFRQSVFAGDELFPVAFTHLPAFSITQITFLSPFSCSTTKVNFP